MDVKSDIIEVAKPDLLEPVGGARPEPEEMPARRVIGVDADATGNLDGSFLGKFNSAITYEETAGTFAQMSGKTCSGCLHWNPELWRKVYVQKFHDPVFNKELNKIRRRIHGDDELDDEAQVRAMGFCNAFTEILQDEVVTHPKSCCPSTNQKGEPLPLMFTPRDAASKNLVTAIYDKTLRMATKKKR